MATDDFLQDEFKQFNFSVAADEPLKRLRKLRELLRGQISQCAEGEIDQRQPRVRHRLGNVRKQGGGLFRNVRRSLLRESGQLHGAKFFIGTQEQRVNQGDRTERFTRGGLQIFRQRVAHLHGVFQMQWRGGPGVGQNILRTNDWRQGSLTFNRFRSRQHDADVLHDSRQRRWLELVQRRTLDRFKLLRFQRRKFSVPRFINRANAVGNRRMRGHEVEQRIAEAVAKKHMAHIRRVGGFQFGTVTVTSDFLQRAGKSAGIARELNGRGVGQKFALAADGGLNQPPEKNANATDDQQGNAEKWQRIFVAAVAAAGVKQNSPDGGEAQNAKNNSQQPEVEPHVAIQNMAEFVADDALQFVARQHLDAAARDADGRVARRMAGGKSVYAFLAIQNVDLRHRHAGGDGHFLDDVEQFAFVRVRRALAHEPSAHLPGHDPAAAGKLAAFPRAPQKNNRQRAKDGGEKNFQIPQGQWQRLAIIIMLGMLHGCVREANQRHEINQRDDEHDRDDEVKNRQLGFFAGLVLSGEEVHLIFRSSRGNEAQFSQGGKSEPPHVGTYKHFTRTKLSVHPSAPACL